MMKRKVFVSFVVFTVIFVSIFASVLAPNSAQSAFKKPMTAPELALYNGPDRQQILEEGARKEGKLTFYTTGILVQTVRPIVDAFQKKYPFIKVEIWRADQAELFSRFREEYNAGRYTADVMETNQSGQILMQEGGMLQPFYSPNLPFIEEGSIFKNPAGALSAGHYQSGISLGYNTKLLKKEDAPKTSQDLLNAKWKGKMAMVSSTTGLTWVGTLLETYGEEFVEKVSRQNIVLQQVSARALLDMVISGEYALSPTSMDSHVNKSKSGGAPVDWMPLEPVATYIGLIMLPKASPHPHAAMLFIDFDLSRQGGELYIANGYDSPRKDLPGSLNYKKYYGPYSTKQVERWKTVFDKYFLK